MNKRVSHQQILQTLSAKTYATAISESSIRKLRELEARCSERNGEDGA